MGGRRPRFANNGRGKKQDDLMTSIVLFSLVSLVTIAINRARLKRGSGYNGRPPRRRILRDDPSVGSNNHPTSRTRRRAPRRLRPGTPVQESELHNDEYYLRKAHTLRTFLKPPRHSNFRVVALLLVQQTPKGGRSKSKETKTSSGYESSASGSSSAQTSVATSSFDSVDSAETRSHYTLIFGTNDEPSPTISGAICAERSAFLQYRTLGLRGYIRSVYIVTDSHLPVPPGTLCREYMYGHDDTSPDTRFVLQSSTNLSARSSSDDALSRSKLEPVKTWEVSLAELYPYPSLFIGMTAQQQFQFSDQYKVKIQEKLQVLIELQELLPVFTLRSRPEETNKLLTTSNLRKMVDAAEEAAWLYDNRDDLHPIRYGAAMAVAVPAPGPSDTAPGYTIQILQSSQVKALEYGASQDAVCQLASKVLALKHQRGGIHDKVMEGEETYPDTSETTTITNSLGKEVTENGSDADNKEPEPAHFGSSVEREVEVLAVVQVDQFGIPHVPFAPARSFLVENGFGDSLVILTTLEEYSTDERKASNKTKPGSQNSIDSDRLAVEVVRADKLAPFVPEWLA